MQFALRHRWTGWDDDGSLSFQTPDGPRVVDARATVLALGGASWPRLGSDGAMGRNARRQGRDDLAAANPPIAVLPSPGPISFAIVSRASR